MTLIGLLAGVAVAAGLMAMDSPRAVRRRLLRLAPRGGFAARASAGAALNAHLPALLSGTGGAWVGLSLWGLAGCVAGGAGGMWVAIGLSTRRARRRIERVEAQVPEALELLAAALRAGRSLRQALPVAAIVGPPLGAAVAHTVAAIESGRPVPEALDALAASEAVLAPACAALRVGIDAGGDVPVAIERLAAAHRAQAHGRGELAALTAQVRLSAALLAALPIAALFVFGVLGTGAPRAFLREPAGQACLIGGLALDAAGWTILRRLGTAGR